MQKQKEDVNQDILFNHGEAKQRVKTHRPNYFFRLEPSSRVIENKIKISKVEDNLDHIKKAIFIKEVI